MIRRQRAPPGPGRAPDPARPRSRPGARPGGGVRQDASGAACVGGPDAGPGRAPCWRCSPRSRPLRRSPRRTRSPPGARRSTGATWTSEAAHPRRRWRSRTAPERRSPSRRATWRQRLAQIPAIRRATVSVALPDEVRVAVTEREALLVWQVGVAPVPRRRRRAACSRELGRRPAEAARRCRWSTTPRARVDGARRGLDAGPGHPRRRAPARLAPARPTSAAARRASSSRLDDPNGFTMRTRAGVAGRRCSGSTRRPCGPRT